MAVCIFSFYLLPNTITSRIGRIVSDTCIVATCFSRIISGCIHTLMYRIRQIGGSSCHIVQRWPIVHGRLFVLVHDSYDLGPGYPWRCAMIDDAAYVNVQKATLVMVIWKLVAPAKLHRSIQTISLLSLTHGKQVVVVIHRHGSSTLNSDVHAIANWFGEQATNAHKLEFYSFT